MSPEERESFEAAARESFKVMRAKWIEEAPMRERQELLSGKLCPPCGLPRPLPNRRTNLNPNNLLRATGSLYGVSP
jgi:hypothetical protein